MAKVKIGDTWYDGAQMPIGIELSGDDAWQLMVDQLCDRDGGGPASLIRHVFHPEAMTREDALAWLVREGR